MVTINDLTRQVYLLKEKNTQEIKDKEKYTEICAKITSENETLNFEIRNNKEKLNQYIEKN